MTGIIKQSLIETRSCGADLVLLVELGRLAANACRVNRLPLMSSHTTTHNQNSEEKSWPLTSQCALYHVTFYVLYIRLFYSSSVRIQMTHVKQLKRPGSALHDLI